MVIIPFDYITNFLEMSLMITVSEYINNNTCNQHVYWYSKLQQNIAYIPFFKGNVCLPFVGTGGKRGTDRFDHSVSRSGRVLRGWVLAGQN